MIYLNQKIKKPSISKGGINNDKGKSYQGNFKLNAVFQRGGVTMNDTMKGMLLVLLLIYVISPVDFCPGPVDDIILLLCTIGGRAIKSNDD